MMRPRECPSCGAPIPKGTSQCGYCGEYLTSRLDAGRLETGPKSAAPKLEARPIGLPKGAGEFGLRGVAPLVVGLVVAAAIYVVGWSLEDPKYWLADGAIAVWAAALPFWLLIVAFVWRPIWGGILAGFLVAVPILVAHCAVMTLVRGRFNDDYLGIAAIFAGAALGGWLLGRALHYFVRWSRVRAGAGTA